MIFEWELWTDDFDAEHAMEVSSSREFVLTSYLDERDCPGHLGVIKLNRPVWHCGYVDVCAKVLSCICHNCGRLKLS